MTPRASLALGMICATGCTSQYDVIGPSRSTREDAGMAADSGAPDSGAHDAASTALDPRERQRLAAFEHTCVARSDGVYCWGENGDGQLGLGGRDYSATPVRIAGLDDVSELCAGERHSCALASDGSLRCWGGNDHGQLGLGNRNGADAPQRVPGSFSHVACGGYVTCALDAAGALSCWGENFEGQVAQRAIIDFLVPTPIAGSPPFSAVSVGQGHVCALDRVGGLWCWGRNSHGQLGLADAGSQLRAPARLDEPDDFRALAAAQQHTCAARRDASLWCWGDNRSAQLGLGPATDAGVPLPSQVPGLRGVYGVAANWFHTCALHGEGVLACFGRNVEGQLGLGDAEPRDGPEEVAGSWDELAVGRFHTCARRGDSVSCWGKNDRGQLGLGDADRRAQPAELSFGGP